MENVIISEDVKIENGFVFKKCSHKKWVKVSDCDHIGNQEVCDEYYLHMFNCTNCDKNCDTTLAIKVFGKYKKPVKKLPPWQEKIKSVSFGIIKAGELNKRLKYLVQELRDEENRISC